MDLAKLNKIAFDNLYELCKLSNDKYIVIDNLEIKIKKKSDDYDDIDNIYTKKDIQYSIYFTFNQLFLDLKNINYIYFNNNHTRKQLLGKMNIAIDNLFYMFENNENENDNENNENENDNDNENNENENDNDNSLSTILNGIDNLLIEETDNYIQHKCYYTIIEKLREINLTFKKIIGHNYTNHTNIIKYYLPDFEPLLLYKNISDEDTPDEDTPDEDSPDEDSPDEDSPDEDTPDEDTPDEDTPDEDSDLHNFDY
tara:strand:+ start:142 stop:909 length:768 start_codon:yes stop_codon:yes gene_type:complete